MRSVTIHSPLRYSPVHQKRVTAEFKVDYQVRRDDRGHETVYKVYLPSTYKGWAIMVEKQDDDDPRSEKLRPDISVGCSHLRL